MQRARKFDSRKALKDCWRQIGHSGDIDVLFCAAGLEWRELENGAKRQSQAAAEGAKEDFWWHCEWKYVFSHLVDEEGRLWFEKLPDFATRQGVSLTTVRRWIASGRLNEANGLFRGYNKWWIDRRKFAAAASPNSGQHRPEFAQREIRPLPHRRAA
jgi:hypothetical protein